MHPQTVIVSAADSADMLANTVCIVVRTLLQTMIPITTSSAIGIQVRKAQSGPRPYCKLLFVVCWSVRMLRLQTCSQTQSRQSHACSNQLCWLRCVVEDTCTVASQVAVRVLRQQLLFACCHVVTLAAIRAGCDDSSPVYPTHRYTRRGFHRAQRLSHERLFA